MGVRGIVRGLLDLHGLFNFFCDVRVHGADHDRREAVSVHIDVRDTIPGGELDLRGTVSRPVASVSALP